MNRWMSGIVVTAVVALACKGEEGAAGPAGPEGQATGTVVSVTAGDGLAGGTITASGTISIAPAGVASTMIAEGAVGPEKVSFTYAASASKGGAAADSLLLGGRAAAEYATSGHAHPSADVTDLDAAAVSAVSAGLPGDLPVAGSLAVGGGVTAAGAVVAGGPVKVGATVATCDAAAAGTIRFTGSGSAFEGCNGTSWVSLTPAPSVAYTRWGRSVCPGDASVVYWGFAAGAHYTHPGSGKNLLCLTSAPATIGSAANENGANVYGVEFLMAGYGLAGSLGDRHGYNALCAVCLAPRAVTVMIPGADACPAGWTAEYTGYVMSDHYTGNGSEFVCVDAAPEVSGSAVVQGGATWYPSEVECGALPCGPYVQDHELSCVVCTR